MYRPRISFYRLCVPPDYARYKTEGKIRLRHRIPVSFFQEEMICNAQIVENCIDVNSFRITPVVRILHVYSLYPDRTKLVTLQKRDKKISKLVPRHFDVAKEQGAFHFSLIQSKRREREGSTNTIDGFSGATLFGNSKMTRTKNG